MRKISKSRADDDVVSSTNGSGSVAYEERQADEPNDQEVDEKSPDEEVDDADDYVEARKKGKYKSKSKASKRKSDRNSNKKDEEDEEAEYEDNDREVDEDIPDEDEDTDDYGESRKKGKKSKNKSSKKKKSDRNSIKKDEEDDEEAEYEVEKIIDSKRIKGKLHYLIRWKGYSASNDTWEPDNTLSCPELISKYNEEKENSKNNSPKKASKRKGSKKASKSSPAKKPKTVWDEKNVDENAEYEVERILEVHHKKNGERSFLIHWKGWSNKFDSWEPESNLNCPELIKRFMDKVSAARATDSRNLRVAPETTNRFTLQAPSSGRRLSKRRGQRQRVRYDNAE